MIKQSIYVVFIGCLCWGCAVKKEKRITEQDVRLTEWNNRDSLWWEKQLEVNERRAINLQHYKLSKPDSCGIQYIEYLTEAAIDGHTQVKENAGAKIETVITSQEHHKQFREEETENQTASKGWPYRVIGIIVCLVLLYLLHKKQR